MSVSNNATAPRLLRALAGERPEVRPVWFMRQAGRSLPEYRDLRERAGKSMLEACLDPEVAAEATLQPVRRHGVDAAVFFSDIMVPLLLAGLDVSIEPGVGPVVAEPVSDGTAVARLTRNAPKLTGSDGIRAGVARAVEELGSPSSRTQLIDEDDSAGWVPLVGFGGAPFTLAAYLVEGRPSRDHLAARGLMHSDPLAWDALLDWCAEATGAFMALQVEAGASALQLFDSWAGSLSRVDYRDRVAPHSARAIEIAKRAVSPTTGRTAPLIHFGTHTSRFHDLMVSAGADALGVDERTPLDDVARALPGVPLQGNIDPSYLTAPQEILDAHVDEVLAAGDAAVSHVVNLGHGVPPTTDPAVLTGIVRRVHDHG